MTGLRVHYGVCCFELLSLHSFPREFRVIYGVGVCMKELGRFFESPLKHIGLASISLSVLVIRVIVISASAGCAYSESNMR